MDGFRENIEYENLKNLELQADKMNELKIKKDNQIYYMKVHPKSSQNKFVIFSNGAVDPQKNTPPVYMRSSWTEDIDASTIFIDDPTLHDTKLRLGWGQGDRDVFYLEEIAEILGVLLKKNNVNYKEVYFFGSSAGGFMSLYYSILLKGTTAIVNNPQTKVLNYLETPVKRMLKKSYDIDGIQSVDNDLMYRLDIAEAIKHYNSIPEKIYYLQNHSCEGDVKNHLHPFLNSLKSYDIELRGLNVISYFNKESGHNPIHKTETIKFINMILKDGMNFQF